MGKILDTFFDALEKELHERNAPRTHVVFAYLRLKRSYSLHAKVCKEDKVRGHFTAVLRVIEGLLLMFIKMLQSHRDKAAKLEAENIALRAQVASLQEELEQHEQEVVSGSGSYQTASYP